MDYVEAKRKVLAQIAERKHLAVDDMKPWEDYDPIIVDEEAYHLAKGSKGVRWTGD